ncbi:MULTISPECIES: AraC family transcriptional regulator [Pseudomonas]|uniref:AraC family transcriptional regulator n=1 Tax=Pseudomonas TaxID=286 RepID=UPI00300360CE
MSLTVPTFWRAAALPFIEARSILDGRKVCYARHAHAHFSIGAITSGQCTYISGDQQHVISEGCVVLMNPQVVHACNPIDGEPWSYRMFYVDCQWLAAIQAQLDSSAAHCFQPYKPILTHSQQLFSALNQLYMQLTDAALSTAQKHNAAEQFFVQMHAELTANEPGAELTSAVHAKLQCAADYIQAHCAEPLSLEQICMVAGLSRSYLIRAFAQHFGMTPHAYLTNQRVQLAQRLLQRGEVIAEAALAAGFADQAHLQRTFKQHLAATPGQYRG